MTRTLIRLTRSIVRSLLLAAALGGCATAYQSSGMTGGFVDHPGPGKLYTVEFHGNGYTSPSLAETYAIYRAAEVAKSLNKPFFLLYDSLSDAALDRPRSAPRIGMLQRTKPSATSFILPLDAPRPGVHDTQATLDDLHDVIATGELTQPAQPAQPAKRR